MKFSHLAVLVIIACSGILASELRFLEDGELPTFRCNMSISIDETRETVIVDGELVLDDRYICVKGGTPANHPFLEEAAFIDGKYCFPHIFMTGLFNRFNPFTQYFYFRIHSPEGAGYKQNIKIKYHFTGQNVEDLEKMFEKLNKMVQATKAEVKVLTDKLFEQANEYNKVTSKLLVNDKSIPEIIEEIDEYKVKIAALKEQITENQIQVNDLTATCDSRTMDLAVVVEELTALNDKAENLDNSINSNKLSIQSFHDALTDLNKVIEETQARIDASDAAIKHSLKECKKILPTYTEKLDGIQTLINERKTEEVNTEIDSFVVSA